GACSGGQCYDPTWDSEGSRTRRHSVDAQPGGTTIRGVAPGHQAAHRHCGGSGAETAFLVLHLTENARATPHRPGAKAPELDLTLRSLSGVVGNYTAAGYPLQR